MKTTLAFVALVVGFVVIGLASTPTARSQAAAPKTRIGVFDSRAIVLAYVRSGQDTRVADLRRDAEAAKAANDQEKIKELGQEAEWMQIRLHQQVFSTATAADVLEKMVDKLPAIAAEARVSAIVSKWEVPYKDSSVELVDVTMPMVKVFNPGDQILKVVEQVMAQEPIPFVKLGLSAKD